MRWLRLLGTWGASGMLSGAVLGGCVRAVDVWIRSQSAKLEAELVNELRARLEELEEELARNGRRR